MVYSIGCFLDIHTPISHMIYDNISIKYDPVNKNSLWRTFNDKFLPKIE